METNENQNAAYEVNFREGKIAVSGPVDFVKEEIAKIRRDINVTQALINFSERGTEATVTAADVIVKSSENFENVINIDRETKKVNVIVNLSGKSKVQATVELSLMFMWGKRQAGVEEVAFQELRSVCQEHGVLDAANFSSHINSSKSYFIISKDGGSYSAKLTVPGIRQAESLLSTYNKSSN